MMGHRGAVRQINVVKKSVIFKEDINSTGLTRVPAIAPAAYKLPAMMQNQLPILMVPTACDAALTLESHCLILLTIENFPGDIPAMAHEIIKAERQFQQGC
ncbi:MAG: hypothetical protein P8Q19_07985, partial [Planktomarina sp.]|nr:hypothetical protein [Planktomarina sp.]